MQNGLAFNDVAAVVGRQRTLAACFNFGGHYEGPGRILHGTTGGFAVGELDGRITPRLGELRDALAAASRGRSRSVHHMRELLGIRADVAQW